MNSLSSFEEIDAISLIRHLNETDEHSRCEAKTSQQIGRSLMETVCAFSNEPNLGGGFLLLGVAKEESLWPTYEFFGLVDPDKLQSDIASRCRTDFNRPVRPQIKVDEVHGNMSLIVFVPEVPASEKPIFFSKEGLPRGAYRRIGPNRPAVLGR